MACCRHPLRRASSFEAEFGRDNDLISHRSEGFAQQFLVLERAVGFGCVEAGDALFEGGADQCNAGLFLRKT